MNKYREVLFVCNDNTCLSPLAEAIMVKELAEQGIDNVVVFSRGMIVLFPEPVNEKIEEVARNKGINISKHVSKRIENDVFGEDILVLVMRNDIKQKIYNTYKNAINVYTIKEFVGEQGDVKVPFGAGLSEYSDTFDLIKRLVENTINNIYGDD